MMASVASRDCSGKLSEVSCFGRSVSVLALEFRKADQIDVLICTRLCPLHGAPRMIHGNLKNLTGRSLVLHGIPVNPGLLRGRDIVAGFEILCVESRRRCCQLLARAL